MVRIHKGDTECRETTAEVDVCSDLRCKFLQVDPATYETKHHQDCDRSKCWDMGADPEKVRQILQTGSIPLIPSVSRDDCSEKISLVSSNPDFTTPYIAISHVWSDGMGNLKRSALPRCQLIHLSMLVRNLTGCSSDGEDTLHLWIDTIGCPPDDTGQTHTQTLAIQLMPQTYRNATAVLVLDAWLQQTEVAHLPHQDILMRIICCNWNSRLWTLQEGTLAQELIFQFADTAYRLNEGLGALREANDQLLALTLRVLIEEKLYEIRPASKRTKGLSRKSKLLALTGALSNRSTSVASDEAICLATLLEFSEGEYRLVTRAPADDRMRVFWTVFDTIPGRILFVDEYPRMETPGYHWAPRSFLLGTKRRPPVLAPRVDLTGISLQRTASGLLYRGSGMVFMAGNVPIGETFFALDEQNRTYLFKCHIAAARGVVTRSAASHYVTRDLESANIDQTDLRRVYLGEMHELHLEQHYDTTNSTAAIIFLSSDRTDRWSDSVLLVAHRRTHRGVNYCRYICHGTYSLMENSYFEKMKEISAPAPGYTQLGHARFISGTPAANSFGTLSFVRGFMYGPEQQWCID